MDNRQIVIIGAGGHGRVLADIARLNGYGPILFLDDADVPGIAGKVCDYTRFLGAADFFVAIGSNRVRKRISRELRENGAHVVNLIHPRAVIAEDATLGTGIAVMAGAIVNAGAHIGNGVILNTCSSVDHDCVVADYVHISVGAHLAGTVHVGEGTFVCAGAVVINNISICADSVVGAGAVVVRNIVEPGTYLGTPARKQLPQE